MKTCSIEGCGKNHYAKGLCKNHYKTEYRVTRRDEIKKYNREYYTENRDEANKRSREYRAENRDEIKKYSREYYTENKDDPMFKAKQILATSRRNANKGSYRAVNITLEELAQMIIDVPVCAIHGGTDCKGKSALCLDHNHETGEVRGWLCSKFNHAEGMLGGAEGTRQLLKYLEQFESKGKK